MSALLCTSHQFFLILISFFMPLPPIITQIINIIKYPTPRTPITGSSHELTKIYVSLNQNHKCFSIF